MTEEMIGLILFVLLLQVPFIFCIYKATDAHLKLIELRQIEREEKFEKWLFEALYSIDQKVLLPPEKERIENETDQEEIKGSVYRPSQDKMAIYRGEAGDYYESV